MLLFLDKKEGLEYLNELEDSITRTDGTLIPYSVIEDRTLISFHRGRYYLQKILNFIFRRIQRLICRGLSRYPEDSEEGGTLNAKLVVVCVGKTTRKLGFQETEDVLKYMRNNRFDIVYLPGLTINATSLKYLMELRKESVLVSLANTEHTLTTAAESICFGLNFNRGNEHVENHNKNRTFDDMLIDKMLDDSNENANEPAQNRDVLKCIVTEIVAMVADLKGINKLIFFVCVEQS